MIKDLLKDPSTTATPVVLYLVDKLGMEALEYEPETVEEYLKRIYPDISKALLDRVHAGIGLFTSDLFWVDPAMFGIICKVLNGKRVDSGSEPELDDIVWGVNEAQLLLGDPESGNAPQFSTAVTAFVHYLFKAAGVTAIPDSIKSWFGDVPYILPIDDAEIAMARQSESDDTVAELDAQAGSKMIACLNQVLNAGIDITSEARAELDQIINGKGDNDAAN